MCCRVVTPADMSPNSEPREAAIYVNCDLQLDFDPQMALDSTQMSEAEEHLAESVSQVVNQCVYLRDLMRARSQEKFKTNEDQM